MKFHFKEIKEWIKDQKIWRVNLIDKEFKGIFI